MSGLIRVSPQQVRAGVPPVIAAADAMAAAVRALSDALPDAGSLYGADPSGEPFLAWYRPRVAALEEAISRTSLGLDGVARGLLATAANLEDADLASVLRSPSP